MEFPLYEAQVWQVYAAQGGRVLAFGDEEIDKMIAWRDSKGVSFPMLLRQDTYDAYVDPPGGVYALDIVTGKKGNLRFAEHGADAEDVAVWFEQLLAEN